MDFLNGLLIQISFLHLSYKFYLQLCSLYEIYFASFVEKLAWSYWSFDCPTWVQRLSNFSKESNWSYLHEKSSSSDLFCLDRFHA